MIANTYTIPVGSCTGANNGLREPFGIRHETTNDERVGWTDVSQGWVVSRGVTHDDTTA